MREGEGQHNDDAEQGDAGRNLGEMLRAARAAQDLSLEEIAAELRIEENMLRALEEHRFEALGAPVFAKGYLKQYGHRLNLSYDDLLAEYYRLADPRDVSIAPSKVIKLRDERQITIWVIAGVVLAVLAVLLLLWWLNQPTTTFTPTSSASSEGDNAGAEADLAPPPLADAVSDSAESPPDATADADAGSDAAAPAGTEPAVVRREGEGPGVAVPTPQAVAEVANDEPFSAGPVLRVVLDFGEDSWVEVTDADGERLFYGLGRAGARTGIAGRPPIDVLLGNANGVRLEVGGEPYAVPEGVRQGNLARFTLDPSD